ncbi:30S ribosomal protein S17 [Candidatus Hodgkinia cicadicola]|uniref:30S ribosomal protein S17 n=1 Tax=Candidatus Hodgkinia cicadicola TaxID=573658 RepID=A0ABX4MHJ9_9HYPH|nr:30S ribosomal protein S17 [Candidatus Hodgkinia cicadicola]
MINIKNLINGIVVKIISPKTKVVLVIRRKNCKKYKKTILKTKKYLVSDKNNNFQIGSRVLIKNCAPISKCKSWFIAKEL